MAPVVHIGKVWAYGFDFLGSHCCMINHLRTHRRRSLLRAVPWRFLQAIFSIHRETRTHTLLLLNVVDQGNGAAAPALKLVWRDAKPNWARPDGASAAGVLRSLCPMLRYLGAAARSPAGIGAEFGRIGDSGSLFVYFGAEGRERHCAEMQFVLEKRGSDVCIHPNASGGGARVVEQVRPAASILPAASALKAAG